MGERKALLISAQRFEDPTIRQLESPSIDVQELASVLEDPAIGGFHVDRLVDQPSSDLLRKIEEFYSDHEADDLLLLYLSGHGHRDAYGRMYFVCTDTRLQYPRATSLSSAVVREIAQESSSRRRVLIVDSCFSGAFPQDHLRKSVRDRPALTDADFPGGGRGQVILTASTEFQYSLEGADIQGNPQPSVFTRYLIEGLRTGEADLDNNGVVDVEELYKFAYERTISAGAQTPRRWASEVEGVLEIAKNPHPRKETLPPDIHELLENKRPDFRLAAVNDELRRLISSSRPGLVLGAVEELQRRAAEDDSARVREAAAAVLAEHHGREHAATSRKTNTELNLAAIELEWRQRGKAPFSQLEFADSLGRPSGSRARVGSPYGLRIVAPRSGFLTLLFLSQSRKWTLGYPGWRPPGVRLQGGRIYRFPQDLQPFPTEYPDVELIEFGEPGVETVVALCSSEPLIGPAPGNPSADTLPLLQEKYVTGLLQAALEMAESAFSYCAVKVAP